MPRRAFSHRHQLLPAHGGQEPGASGRVAVRRVVEGDGLGVCASVEDGDYRSEAGLVRASPFGVPRQQGVLRLLHPGERGYPPFHISTQFQVAESLLPAHRLILASHSPVFRAALLAHEQANKEPAPADGACTIVVSGFPLAAVGFSVPPHFSAMMQNV